MTTTATLARDIPQTSPERAAHVHAAEFRALWAMLEAFDDADWAQPTDCEGWTVREMTAHMVGAAEEALRLRVFARHWLWQGRRRYPRLSQLDAANQCQVDDRRGRSGSDIAAEFAAIGPKAVARLRRHPLRRMRLPKSDPLLPGAPMTYMFDVISIRDMWMHRVDAARATGRELVLREHDREVVAQVVRDLARQWDGPPLVLELAGPAGGCWTLGDGDPVAFVHADAVGYLRALSGRDDDPELRVSGDAAAGAAVRSARVVF
jgi:uncharacterized protein (TIGR03083 family)